jgi:LmbE family N-acetylglucosaminyl deacetylase
MKRIEYVIISPHADDAALSCGSLLAARGPQCRVVTVCAGIPDPGVEVSTWDRSCGFTNAAEAAQIRREEDRSACASVGAELVQLPKLDAEYATVLAIGEMIASIESVVDAGTVLVPAGIGGHPDHVFTRHIALTAAKRAGRPVRIYADAPYGASIGWRASDSEREGAFRWGPKLRQVAAKGFVLAEPTFRDLDPEQHAGKIALVRHYASQLAVLGAVFPELSHVPGALSTEVWWETARA